MRPMTRNERKAFEFASEFYDVVFAQLDAMPILNGEQAGRIAQKVQDFVERQILQQLNETGGVDDDARERIGSIAQQPAALLRLEAEFNDLVTKLDEANATMLGEWATEFRAQPHLEALNLAWQAWNKIAAAEKPDPRVHSHITSLKNELKKLLPVKAKP